jgi:hypothetical protein
MSDQTIPLLGLYTERSISHIFSFSGRKSHNNQLLSIVLAFSTFLAKILKHLKMNGIAIQTKEHSKLPLKEYRISSNNIKMLLTYLLS